jgi:hypothetical protein
MAQNSLEERIAHLEAENKHLMAENDRWVAEHEIRNLMGKYEFLIAAQKGKGVIDLFAQRDDSTFDVGDWGVYKGYEGIKKYNLKMDEMARLENLSNAGFAAEVGLSTSVIEVAGDGKTAKAVWMAPGYETTRDPETGKLRAGWIWVRYANDFIKENGKWKIWHLKVFLSYYADYDKSWVEAGTGEHYSRRPDTKRIPLPEGGVPSPHRHLPYDPNAEPVLLPAFPEPYETYDGSQDWIDPQTTGNPEK